ncbi:MAG TPA: sensor histidine kinase [Candidatus Limnocylindria bacterium]
MTQPQRGRGDLAIAGVIGALVVVTGVVVLDPQVAPAYVNAPLDLVLNAAAALVAVAVAILAWTHYREDGNRGALIRASAFLVLAAQNLVPIGIAVAGQSRALGLDLAEPGQLPLWSVILGRGAAAQLFVVAGLLASSVRPLPVLAAGSLLVGPTLAVVALNGAMIAAHASLPELLDANAVAQLRADPTSPLLEAAGAPLILLQAGIGIAFLAAALISYRRYRREGRDEEAYLAIGFILAAFSQLHSALHPGSFASLVTSGDLLRMAFYAVVLVAVAVETRADIRALRRANLELVRLREADVARATAEERARLAREIHDGMSQELWYAKLKQGRLVGLDSLPDAARELAREVQTALESALSEARQAILALRPSEGATFAQVMDRYVGDFADRFGIPADADIDPAGDRLPARAQAELLRIVQEALNNAHRHADATRVRVRLERDASQLRLSVSDNGRGFDTSAVSGGGYGLRSMAERAEIIGARLTVHSAPGDGTRVLVEVPLVEAG